MLYLFKKFDICIEFLVFRQLANLCKCLHQYPVGKPYDLDSPLFGVAVSLRKPLNHFLLWMLMALSAPVVAAPIDLSQLCGSGDCVVSANTTIVSASGPLSVAGNFTVNSGVVLEYLVPIRIDVAGNMVLAGILGAPGNGGNGGAGGSAGQPGSAGGSAPAVVSGIFNVQGSISLDSNATATADGGTGGSGGLPGFGSSIGGTGGSGGAAGSFTFNTCSAFTSAGNANILANGGPGGVGQTGAPGGAGGAGGSIIINAKQTIVSNATFSALGGAGGTGGSGTGVSGAAGSIELNALGAITVASGTLSSGSNTPSVNPAQSSISALAFCPAPGGATLASIPTLSEWALLLLGSLVGLLSIQRLSRRAGSRSNSKSGL